MSLYKKNNEYVRPSWDSYFMALAKMAASRSTCISRRVGAVIVKNKQVFSTGYNGPLSGWEHCTDIGYCIRREKGFKNSEKYGACPANHAEANAVALAAKKGISTDGSTLYVTLFPCPVCAKLVIAAGIKEIVYEANYAQGGISDEKSEELAKNYFSKSNIKVKHHKISKKELSMLEEILKGTTSVRMLKPTD